MDPLKLDVDDDNNDDDEDPRVVLPATFGSLSSSRCAIKSGRLAGNSLAFRSEERSWKRRSEEKLVGVRNVKSHLEASFADCSIRSPWMRRREPY